MVTLMLHKIYQRVSHVDGCCVMPMCKQVIPAVPVVLSYTVVLTTGGGGRGTPGSGGRAPGLPNNKLMVFGLSRETEPYTLEEMFKGCTDVYLPKDRETGERRGLVS